MIEKIAVFCRSHSGNNRLYRDIAKQLGYYLANNNIDLIYGGKIGLMGVVADSVLEKGGTVIGIIPELLKQKEVVHYGVSECIITHTLSERKQLMSKLTDAYIVLPGGFGTLDELYEVLTLQQLRIETKPIGLLNSNGFFSATIQQLKHMVTEGFLKPENRKMLLVDDTIEGLMQQIQHTTTS